MSEGGVKSMLKGEDVVLEKVGCKELFVRMR
jgi:hypothetical protein